MTREERIEAAARHIYEDKGNRCGVEYVGWDSEPEAVKDKWRVDVRASIDAYEALSASPPAIGEPVVDVLRDSNSLFAALLIEKRPDAEIEAQITANNQALAAAPQAPATDAEIKPLAWRKSIPNNTLSKAKTVLGEYTVWTHHQANGDWFWSLSGQIDDVCKSENEAKAAAQADYETRIGSCLESHPAADAVEALKAAVWEEAAKVVEANQITDAPDGQILTPRIEGNRVGLAYAAALRSRAIRAETAERQLSEMEFALAEKSKKMIDAQVSLSQTIEVLEGILDHSGNVDLHSKARAFLASLSPKESGQ